MRMEYQLFSIFRKFFRVFALILASLVLFDIMSQHCRVPFIVLEQFDWLCLLKMEFEFKQKLFHIVKNAFKSPRKMSELSHEH